MKNTYLKPINIALVAAIGMSTSGLLAYSVNVKNSTDCKMKVVVVKALCGSEEKDINPNDSDTIETGICCSAVVKVIGISGSLNGQTRNTGAPSTGGNMSCRGYKVTITKTSDNRIELSLS